MAKYWVGGSGNTSDTAHWATSSGGAGSTGVPTSSDNVIFDSLSNATAYTVTVDSAMSCADFTMAGPLVGAVTWAGSSALNIFGSMNLSGGTAGITRTYTGLIKYTATTTGKTQSVNGVTLASAITFDGIGGGWTFNDTVSTTGIITLTRGTLNTNGVSVTASSISSSNSNTRTLTLGASTINVNEAGGGWNTPTITNLTFNANTSTINIGNNTPALDGGGLTFYNVVFTALNGAAVNAGITGANTFNNLTITKNSTASAGLFKLSANQTINGILTINGFSSTTARIFIYSSVLGTARTLTAATVTITNADFQDIIGAGAGSWNLSAITGLSGDCGGNSGITFTTPVTTNWTSGATWSTATWSSRVPLPQDTATFTTAGVATITQDMPRIGSVDFSTSANKTWTTSTVCSYFGSINLTNLTTLTASTQTYNYEGRGSSTLTSAGFSFAKNMGINTPGGTLTLGDTFSSTAQIVLTSGTFTTNNFNATCSSVNTTNSNVRTFNLGSSTITLTDTGTVWNAATSTNLTLNAGTSTIKSTNTTATARTFAGGGKTYNNFWHAGGAGGATLTISGSNTFADFKDDGSVAHSLLFTAGTTQTVTTFTVSGTAGNLITINSTTTVTFTLTAPSRNNASPVSCDYLNIQHCICPQANTWYAGVNSVNNQAVATAGSGWIFTAPAIVASTNASFLFLMAK